LEHEIFTETTPEFSVQFLQIQEASLHSKRVFSESITWITQSSPIERNTSNLAKAPHITLRMNKKHMCWKILDRTGEVINRACYGAMGEKKRRKEHRATQI